MIMTIVPPLFSAGGLAGPVFIDKVRSNQCPMEQSAAARDRRAAGRTQPRFAEKTRRKRVAEASTSRRPSIGARTRSTALSLSAFRQLALPVRQPRSENAACHPQIPAEAQDPVGRISASIDVVLLTLNFFHTLCRKSHNLVLSFFVSKTNKVDDCKTQTIVKVVRRPNAVKKAAESVKTLSATFLSNNRLFGGMGLQTWRSVKRTGGSIATSLCWWPCCDSPR
jgi:hypothetical protein